ncbi:proline iminopeptidase-family hydrolase [Arthrobacter sp. CDRTa11]|uniref:proline iminopeptidase-family hydrolase n=1 Tax=Arthrobacter sp. CDRTa11 TaxID=2651199 RepID=UPI0022659B3D|nr:proline iminopeptidase-family hydrolase [Arthrobacter sp. CDRTa11]
MPAHVHAVEGYAAVRGGRTWYSVVGEGTAVPLVTVHGGPGGTHDYLEPLEALADERAVVFYDQLGAGKSDAPEDISLWTNDRMVEELGQVLDTLAFSRVHLLGQSWGTIIAAEYALRSPGRLAGLVLSDPCLSMPLFAAATAALRATLPTDVQEVLDRHEAAGTMDSEEYEQAAMEFYSRFVCRLNPWPDALMRSFGQLNQSIYERMQGPNEFIISGIHKDYDITDRLGSVAVPTLFICGRYGETRPEETEFYRSLVPGAELVIFEESSHLPHLEERERYLEVLRDFLHRFDRATSEGKP